MDSLEIPYLSINKAFMTPDLLVLTLLIERDMIKRKVLMHVDMFPLSLWSARIMLPATRYPCIPCYFRLQLGQYQHSISVYPYIHTIIKNESSTYHSRDDSEDALKLRRTCPLHGIALCHKIIHPGMIKNPLSVWLWLPGGAPILVAVSNMRKKSDDGSASKFALLPCQNFISGALDFHPTKLCVHQPCAHRWCVYASLFST